MLLNVVCFLSLGVCGWIVSLCSYMLCSTVIFRVHNNLLSADNTVESFVGMMSFYIVHSV